MQSVGRNVRQSSLTSTSGLLVIVTPAAIGGVLAISYLVIKLAEPSSFTVVKILICLVALTLAGVAGSSLTVLLTMTTAVRRKGGRR